MNEAGRLRQLFADLVRSGYEWTPQTPQRLLEFREHGLSYRPLVQWLGLGLPVSRDDLILDGLDDAWLQAFSPTQDPLVPPYAVSRDGDLFIVHDHWPPRSGHEEQYVHYAAESGWLARAIRRDLEGFIGKKVLDLGCSSGGLSFEVAGVADQVLGLDVCTRAVGWARACAEAYGFAQARFEAVSIGTSQADAVLRGRLYDRVVMNPPMAIPTPGQHQPHRDGGALGLQLPLVFVDFAAKHLVVGGELMCTMTNPVQNGRGLFFDALKVQRREGLWEVMEKTCLHPHFNQSLARKEKYGEQGIERVELWFLHLRRTERVCPF